MENAIRNEMRANIDQASCGCAVIYIVGWGFSEKGKDESIRLILEGATFNTRVEVPVRQLYRRDVNEYFGLDESRKVGFSIQQPLAAMNISELPAGRYNILVQTTASDGSIIELKTRSIDISWPEEIVAITTNPEQKNLSGKQRRYASHSIVSRLRKIWYGYVGMREDDLQQYLFSNTVTAKGILKVNEVNDRFLSAVTYANATISAVTTLLRHASKNGGLVIIFDHNFGGGANLFSRRLLEQNERTHNVVLRVWYEPATSRVMGNISYSKSAYLIHIGSINDLFALLATFRSAVTQINNLYGWPYIERILDNIIRMRIYGITSRLEYFAHDHIAICPSLFLMNHEDNYCGVPLDTNVCTQCLKNNQGIFKVFYHQTNLENWRSIWRSFLLNVDYVRFFSEATRREYLKAFPLLKNSNCIVVDPHHVDVKFSEKLNVNYDDHIVRVGIFGFIDKHKGSEVVLELVNVIRAQKESMEIHVFGSLNGITSGSDEILKLHGSYDRSEIVMLLNKYKINVAFVPSVCPETFSFVTAELLDTGIDVVSFDLGAQSDLTNSRVNGHVFPRGDNRSLVEYFSEFNRELTQC